MRAAVRAARQARWREASRGAAARLLALHTRRPALRRRVAAAAARLRAQAGTPVLLELPPLPPIDLVGHEEGSPVAAEARDAAGYEAVCELAATWRAEQAEEAAAAAEEELAFAQDRRKWNAEEHAWLREMAPWRVELAAPHPHPKPRPYSYPGPGPDPDPNPEPGRDRRTGSTPRGGGAARPARHAAGMAP